MNRITNLLLLLIVTSLFLPATGIMYASGSTDTGDESADGGSTESSEESDSGSMDDESDSGSMDNNDDKSDAWSMEKSNNALDSGSMDDESGDGSMDDESGDGSMDDESDAWSMEKSNNALAPGTTETSGEPDSVPTGTTDTLTPLAPGSNNALNPLGTIPAETALSIGGPPGTNDALNPLSSGSTGTTRTSDALTPLIPGPTGDVGDDYTLNPPGIEPTRTNDTLTPSSGFRIEGNNTGGVQQQSANISKTILTVHNEERALVGVPPLTWNSTLAAGAQAWADHITTTGQFGHSQCSGCYGESITGLFNMTDSGIIEGVHDFTKEKNKVCASTGVCSPGYHGGPFYPYGWPNPPPELGGNPGHYTQVVWKSTTSVGCATSPAGTLPFAVLVCRYYPPGNYIGESAY